MFFEGNCVKALKVSICIALTQPVKMLSISKGIDRLLGFKQDDFISGKRSLQSLVHTNDKDAIDVLFSYEVQPDPTTFNIRFRHSDGRIRCINGQYIKVKEPVVHLGINTSQRKKCKLLNYLDGKI